MKIYEKNGLVWVEPNDYYDLAKTLTCGQCFRWKYLAPGAYLGIHRDHAVTAYQEKPGDPIALMTDMKTVEEVWVPYFDFNAVYDERIKSLNLDAYAQAAYEYSRGIHLLNQDLWEMIISYIISQRNRLANIGAVVDRMAASCNHSVEYCESILYSFPSAKELNELPDSVWAKFMLGYRIPYVRDMVSLVANVPNWVEDLAQLPTQSAYDLLVSRPGIGAKVANCILLFGMHRTESFLIDVWIQRVIDQHYAGHLDASRYGDMAGIIQQYMFNYIRN